MKHRAIGIGIGFIIGSLILVFALGVVLSPVLFNLSPVNRTEVKLCNTSSSQYFCWGYNVKQFTYVNSSQTPQVKHTGHIQFVWSHGDMLPSLSYSIWSMWVVFNDEGLKYKIFP